MNEKLLLLIPRLTVEYKGQKRAYQQWRIKMFTVPLSHVQRRWNLMPTRWRLGMRAFDPYPRPRYREEWRTRDKREIKFSDLEITALRYTVSAYEAKMSTWVSTPNQSLISKVTKKRVGFNLKIFVFAFLKTVHCRTERNPGRIGRLFNCNDRCFFIWREAPKPKCLPGLVSPIKVWFQRWPKKGRIQPENFCVWGLRAAGRHGSWAAGRWAVVGRGPREAGRGLAFSETP